jgi:hypothetical protein
MSDEFLAQIAPKWPIPVGLFSSNIANLIAMWCVDSFRKHSRAPKSGIQVYFEKWSAREKNEDGIALVSRALSNLSEEHGESDFTLSVLLDMAGAHFDHVALQRMTDKIQGSLDSGDVEEARKAYREHSSINLGARCPRDLLQDKELSRAAFAEIEKPLFSLRGELGKLIDDVFVRDAFVAIVAPEKRGKTYFLMEIAWRAMLKRNKTIFFQLGDLSESQMVRRFHVRAMKRPYGVKQYRYPIEIVQGENSIECEFEERCTTDVATSQMVEKAHNQIMEKDIKAKEPYLKLLTSPSNTTGVADIRSHAINLTSQGWCPDVIVIDYADIMHMPDSKKDERHRINDLWSGMRALSTELHCLVVVASQASRGAYNADVITMEHNSEDKRKAAHVTAMIGLNQTPSEKSNQLLRVNVFAKREGDFDVRKCIYVAQCLDIANPCVLSAAIKKRRRSED